MLCQDKTEEGGAAVAAVTDGNVVLAQKAGPYTGYGTLYWQRLSRMKWGSI